ncbi:hypothetical protein PVAP13_1NG206400 [Panicum virgatum]|uniref:Uncharacterized protein n=1 Tax=Panicum virgatum TaxID=38727 RepID=A0A8T0WTZ4_PANVG|nr:hypothetical protein PVAP13_1NG206400 [Panicum virgatum]
MAVRPLTPTLPPTLLRGHLGPRLRNPSAPLVLRLLSGIRSPLLHSDAAPRPHQMRTAPSVAGVLGTSTLVRFAPELGRPPHRNVRDGSWKEAEEPEANQPTKSLIDQGPSHWFSTGRATSALTWLISLNWECKIGFSISTSMLQNIQEIS